MFRLTLIRPTHESKVGGCPRAGRLGRMVLLSSLTTDIQWAIGAGCGRVEFDPIREEIDRG